MTGANLGHFPCRQSVGFASALRMAAARGGLGAHLPEIRGAQGRATAVLGCCGPANLTPRAALLDAMLEHPVLVNRPLVCSPKGVRLCRPSEFVLDLLDRWPEGPVYKEDGEMILDALGHRVV